MHRRHRLLAHLAAAVVAAAMTGSAGADSPDASAVGRWVAVEIAGNPPVEGTSVTLDIGADGVAGGSSGCNRFRGSVAIDADTIRFGPLAGTRMACAPDVNAQEAAFLNALETAQRWSLEVGPLVLLGPDGAAVAVFDPAP